MSNIGISQLQEVMEMCKEYGVTKMKYEDIEFEMDRQLPKSLLEFVDNEKKITDEDIQLDPYVGLK